MEEDLNLILDTNFCLFLHQLCIHKGGALGFFLDGKKKKKKKKERKATRFFPRVGRKGGGVAAAPIPLPL